MLSINLSNLEKNVSAILKDERKLIGVVKNNAYGCGARKISEKLISLGIDTLFVNDLNEAKELLELNCQIIIHNSINDYELLKNYPQLIITINSIEDYLKIQNVDFPLTCHIQIDTGMNRLGIKDFTEFTDVIKFLNKENIYLDGIYTHFASPQSANRQLEEFQKYVNYYPFPKVHCAASSTYANIHFGNYVRVGLSLYDINQVLTVKTRPLAIRKLSQGESIGYDSLYTASSDEFIAILPIGYGNGYLRRFEGFHVYCNGKLYPIVGRICMNHLFIRVDSTINQDSIFELTSPNLPAKELSNYIKCSNYEIYTNFKFNEVEYLS